jgi:hypothetical protein
MAQTNQYMKVILSKKTGKEVSSILKVMEQSMIRILKTGNCRFIRQYYLRISLKGKFSTLLKTGLFFILKKAAKENQRLLMKKATN